MAVGRKILNEKTERKKGRKQGKKREGDKERKMEINAQE